MTLKPKKPSNISLKRISIGFVILFPCTIMIIVIGMYYYNLIDSSLRQHYIGKQTNEVLGTETETEQEPHLIGSYGDVGEGDTFIWDWDSSWWREGSYMLNRLIERPEYYLVGDEFTLNDSWSIRNEYKLDINCSKVERETAAGMNPHNCTLSYNDIVISDYVRYDVYCSDYHSYDNCGGKVKFALFSDTQGSKLAPEYVVVSEYATGSKDWISLYRLENGEITKLPFPSSGNLENPDSWYISSNAYELYGVDSTWENSIDFNDPIELVTYFHEPSMGSKTEGTENNVEGIYRIWGVVDDKLELKENVIDLYREGDLPHWF